MDEENQEIVLPEWTRFVASGIGAAAAASPWTQDWGHTSTKVWFSIVVFFLVANAWLTLWFMVQWGNQRETLRRYNLLDDDDG